MRGLSDDRRINSKSGGVLKPALFAALFLAASGVLSWMLLLPDVVAAEVRMRTGFEFNADQMACNPFGMNLAVRKARVVNPGNFEADADMLSIEYLDLKMAVTEWSHSDKVVRSMDLKIDQVTLVIDEKGRLNLGQFVDLLGVDTIQFSKVRLRVRALKVINYQPTIPVVRDYQLGLDVSEYQAQGVAGLLSPIVVVAKKAGYLPAGVAYDSDGQNT